jgi:hypothetical protein
LLFVQGIGIPASEVSVGDMLDSQAGPSTAMVTKMLLMQQGYVPTGTAVMDWLQKHTAVEPSAIDL